MKNNKNNAKDFYILFLKKLNIKVFILFSTLI